jgi:hypothetical protein
MMNPINSGAFILRQARAVFLLLLAPFFSFATPGSGNALQCTLTYKV